jgi:hypothetical protein
VKPSIDDRLNEIAQRTAKATPGPWKAQPRLYNGPAFVHVASDDTVVSAHQDDPDAQFIANAPCDVQWLLAQVDQTRQRAAGFAAALIELKEENERLKRKLQFLYSVTTAQQSPR